MNCKQVEAALPLFAGGELAERREHEIAHHLASCLDCAQVAGEYRESREMLQAFATPIFSDDVYDEIRRNVWRQIEAQPQSLSPARIFSSWFRPQVAWAVALALLIGLSTLAIYFIRSEPRAAVPFASSPTPPVTPAGDRAASNPTPTPLSPSKGEREDRQADSGQRRRRPDHRRAPDRAPTLAQNSPGASPTKIETGPQTNGSFDPSSVTSSEKMLRLEMQTRNPNIRIIWFAQKEPKSAVPNPKGT